MVRWRIVVEPYDVIILTIGHEGGIAGWNLAFNSDRLVLSKSDLSAARRATDDDEDIPTNFASGMMMKLITSQNRALRSF